MERDDLYNHLLKATRVLETKVIQDAFKAIDRKDFVHADYEVEAYEDYALPIGFGSTIVKPSTLAFMLELLDIKGGERVLNVGAGSGWSTALIAHMVGARGLVFGIEVVPELVRIGKENLKKYNFANAEIRDSLGLIGLIAESPFDRILVSAAVEEVPDELLSELKVGGIMVLPIGETLARIIKKEKGYTVEKEFPGFLFDPFQNNE
jgi:protein-L-isoaspartate(D-aspartate) O-methyltransferase